VADIGKLLWPKSVAVIGASSDVRGRIFEIIRSRPFVGQIYLVSRRALAVQGVTVNPSLMRRATVSPWPTR